MRSDAPLIKHLSKEYNPRLGWEWQRLPLIELPSTRTDDLEAIGEVVKQSGAWLDADALRMPFDDFVLDLWYYNDDDPEADEPTMHGWIRVTRGTEYARRMSHLSPWNLSLPSSARRETLPPDVLVAARAEQTSLVLESWTQEPNGTALTPPLTIYLYAGGSGQLASLPMSPLAAGLYKRAMKGEPAFQKAWSDVQQADCLRAFNLTLYLTMCPEYLVEEQSELPAGAPARRNPDPKPWTYNYLPRIILLDPSEAPSGEKHPDQGGTHASPRPHQRRGHWARLRDPKYRRNEDGSPRAVFRKPAWVGPREWIMEGSRYRVIDTGAKA